LAAGRKTPTGREPPTTSTSTAASSPRRNAAIASSTSDLPTPASPTSAETAPGENSSERIERNPSIRILVSKVKASDLTDCTARAPWPRQGDKIADAETQGLGRVVLVDA
jgi:hypothetical protein